MNTSAFINRSRFFMLTAVIALCFVTVFGRLCFLHVMNRDSALKEIETARNRFSVQSARRGNITDSHGKLLAATRPVIEFGVDPLTYHLNKGKRADDAEKFTALSKLLKMKESELEAFCAEESFVITDSTGKEIKRDVRWRKISGEMDDFVYEQIKSLNIKGFYGNRKYIRTYPSETLASHVIGFVNSEFSPEMGVERQCDFYLRGQDGWLQTEMDATRKELTQFRSRDVSPVDGMNVELSIDLVMQESAQSELKKIVDDYKPVSACIIISEPTTGYILAMASYPTFDPNNYGKFPVESMRNRAICDQIEPGSTFKIVPIAAALNENLVTQDDVFDCASPVVSYKGKMLRLPKDSHPEGRLSVREITAKSSNRGAAQLGAVLGENRLYNYAKLFGFGDKTNIGLVGEIGGTLHSPRVWDGLTITRLPMGHAVAATPLQIHCAMSAIANNGILMQPQLVKRVYDKENSDVVAFHPKAVRKVLNAKTAKLMQDILADVVSDKGTARRASVQGFKVAGKTGTTQKIINGQYSSSKHVASFTGFFPAQRPRLVVTIIVDEPHSKGTGYGGTVAAPAFSQIAKQAANYYGIQNDDEHEEMLAWKGRN